MTQTDVTATQFTRYAQANNGMLIALEHRFFGQSQPKSDLGDLRLLTIAQAMQDAVSFITSYKAQRGAPNVPVYTIGTSYGGNLASWLRIQYPNVFAGSLASSAPVQLVRDFSAYMSHVKDSIDTITGSSTCTSNIQAGFQALQTAMSDSSNMNSLTSQFTLCYTLLNTATDKVHSSFHPL